MSQLTVVTQKLKSTEAQLFKTQQLAIENGMSFGDQLEISSLEKRLTELRLEYERVANTFGLDVAYYRCFEEGGDSPKLAPLAGVLGGFQDLISVVYDAIKNGPKARARVAAEVERLTAFNVAYTFEGSVGVALTIRTDKTLIEESYLDQAFRTVFEMAESNSSDQIAHFSRELGPGPVRALYSWAKSNSCKNLGAQIAWRRDSKDVSSFISQPAEFAHLLQVIDEVSDAVTEELLVMGRLIAASIRTHTFELERENDELIRGRMAPEIGDSYTVNLPRWYKARLLKTTKINYATESDDTDYTLLNLQEA